MGYELVSSLAKVYTTAMTSPVEILKYTDEKVTWLANTATYTFPLQEFFGGQISWAASNLALRNLTSREFQLEAV